MESLVKTPYARNMWAIMKEFKVLPTEKRFQDLTYEQMDFIIASMNRDSWLEYQASKGQQHMDNLVEDDDTSWWDTSHDEFDPVPDFLDAEDLAKQVEDKMSDLEKEQRQNRFDAEMEDEEDLMHQNKMEMIRRNIEELDDELANGRFDGDLNPQVSQESINQALNEFDDEDDLYI